MFYAILFFLLGVAFTAAGSSLWDESALSKLAASGFFFAAPAEFVTGGLYAAASLFRVNPGPIFKDRWGRLRHWSRPFIWPYLIFEYVAWRQHRKRGHELIFEQVSEGLWLGSRPVEEDLPALRAAGINAVLDLTAEMQDPPELRRSSRYLCVPTLDGCAPGLADFAAGTEFVKACRAEGRSVLIHCTFGHGRSAALMAASMVALGLARSADEALGQLKKLKRRIFLSREQRGMLERFIKSVV